MRAGHDGRPGRMLSRPRARQAGPLHAADGERRRNELHCIGAHLEMNEVSCAAVMVGDFAGVAFIFTLLFGSLSGALPAFTAVIFLSGCAKHEAMMREGRRLYKADALVGFERPALRQQAAQQEIRGGPRATWPFRPFNCLSRSATHSSARHGRTF